VIVIMMTMFVAMTMCIRIFLRVANCCSLNGVGLSMGRVGALVHKFIWQWVGLGQLFGGLGWVWVDERNPWTTLSHAAIAVVCFVTPI